LADCCDAYFAPKSQVERKAIMKDPRNGTFGSLALILQVLLVSALLSKFSAVTGFFVILTAQVMAKVAMVNLFIFAKRTYLANANNFVSSSISMFLEKLTVVRLIINNLYLIPWFYFTPKLATAILILILFFTWAWNKFSLRQVGSLTGDAFGALHEILFSFTLFIAIVVTHLSGGHLG
jgi:adenosylcobinamide-GDP ribazoletransferase